MQGITASALRKRRLAGKLDGQYIKKGSDYFYCITRTDGPNKQTFTVKNSRRRHVPRSEVQYHKAHNGHQLQQANDIKQYVTKQLFFFISYNPHPQSITPPVNKLRVP